MDHFIHSVIQYYLFGTFSAAFMYIKCFYKLIHAQEVRIGSAYVYDTMQGFLIFCHYCMHPDNTKRLKTIDFIEVDC